MLGYHSHTEVVVGSWKKKGASDVTSDLISSYNVYHRGPASEWKTVLKKVNL